MQPRQQHNRLVPHPRPQPTNRVHSLSRLSLSLSLSLSLFLGISSVASQHIASCYLPRITHLLNKLSSLTRYFIVTNISLSMALGASRFVAKQLTRSVTLSINHMQSLVVCVTQYFTCYSTTIAQISKFHPQSPCHWIFLGKSFIHLAAHHSTNSFNKAPNQSMQLQINQCSTEAIDHFYD